MGGLIINADDLGLSDSVNQAVLRLYERSAITGSSIIPAGRRFVEAAGMLKEKGIRETGVHLTLTGKFQPVTGKSFFSGYMPLLASYYSGTFDLAWARGELFAQVERVLEQGLEPTHIDSHEHVHMLPGILNAALEACREFNIRYIRFPLEDGFVKKINFSVKDVLRHLALRVFAERAGKVIASSGTLSCGHFLGHFHSGRINARTLDFFLDNIGDGITELAVHPAVMSRELLEDSPWHKNGQIEMEALLSEDWKEKLKKRGIRLISHKEAVGER
jgi:chitin disaccharide deacetylase